LNDEKEKAKKTEDNKIVCIYAYYEKNEQYKEHLRLFIENAIRPNIDYFIAINGSCSLDRKEMEKNPNVKIITRPNTGFDFGAWMYCLNHVITKEYDYYTFVNSSVKYVKNKEYDWFSHFEELFQDRSNIQLVGTSINILTYMWDSHKQYLDAYSPPYTHVQSMFFVLNRDGMSVLKNAGFWENEDEINAQTDITWIIVNKEIMMSQIILSSGGGINAILSKYRGKDYTKIKENINFSSNDPYYDGAYFGESISPDEVIFYKNNR
jgi:hypothetical protein